MKKNTKHSMIVILLISKMILFLILTFPLGYNTLMGQDVSGSEMGLKAYYTKIDSGEEFEKFSRTGPFADIVVEIGKVGKLIFSRATSYLPAWVTEKGNWSVEEIIKRSGDGPDKRPDYINRYSHVRIIENNPARVIVHWRYVPNQNHTDIDDWVDEYFTVSPSGYCTRTYRHGTEKLDDWGDPQNMIVKHLEFNLDGIKYLDSPVISIPESIMVENSVSHYNKEVEVSFSQNISPQILPIAWLGFDERFGNETKEIISNTNMIIDGHKSLWKAGIKGSSLQFDGYKSAVVIPSEKAPVVSDGITIEAWIAIGAYPWNWAPVVQQSDWEEKGYYLGLDANGCAAFMISINGKWKIAHGLRRLTPFEWYHLSGTYDSGNKVIRLYVNGELAADCEASGEIVMSGNDLLISLNNEKMTALDTERNHFPAIYGFDGLIDEVKIYNRALSAEGIEKSFEQYNPDNNDTDMESRTLPFELDAVQQFGAYYTKLKYYETWDNLWRLSEHPDIVVRFDDNPCSIKFWHGATFSPGFVTENNKWVMDQSLEEGGGGVKSLAEHMSDKQFRYSHVRLIENHDARVVVHWRYSNCDVLYNIPRTNQETGWGDWVDEYYFIYPDGVAIRNVKYWSETYGHYSWQDIHILSEPGTRPEEHVDYTAGLFLANQKGETAEIGWVGGKTKNELEDANIELINTFSNYKPFLIFEEDARIHVSKWITGYALAGTWNHWPVAQIPSDGREAHDPYRVTHTTLAATDIDDFKRGDIAMYGFTDRSVDSLIPLAKSWNNNPELKITSGDFLSEGYNRGERAYVINAAENSSNTNLEFELDASEDHPIVSPAFVIKNGPDGKVILKINDELIEPGENFRCGKVYNTDRTDVIVWLKYTSIEKTKFDLLQ